MRPTVSLSEESVRTAGRALSTTVKKEAGSWDAGLMAARPNM